MSDVVVLSMMRSVTDVKVQLYQVSDVVVLSMMRSVTDVKVYLYQQLPGTKLPIKCWVWIGQYFMHLSLSAFCLQLSSLLLKQNVI